MGERLLAPTPEQVEQAKAQYAYALEVLLAAQRALDHETKLTLIGKCFKHRSQLAENPMEAWPVYTAATSIDTTGRLLGWRFQHAPTNQIEVAVESDLQPGFLLQECVEVPRAEFIATFNELLTTLARYTTWLPD